MVFSIFTRLCYHYYYLNSEYFYHHHHPKKPIYISTHSPSPLPQSLQTTSLLSVSVDFAFSGHFSSTLTLFQNYLGVCSQAPNQDKNCPGNKT